LLTACEQDQDGTGLVLLQYHWCPTAFSVITGLSISPIKYNSRRDGIAVSTQMTAGAIVEMVSIICPSRMNLLVYFG